MSATLDVFPADVDIDGARIQNARALVIDGRFVVVTRRQRDWFVTVNRQLDSYERLRARSWSVTLTDGTTCTVRRGTGCGCGSPLKRLNVSEIMAAA